MNICGAEGHTLGLEISSDKSAVMVFKDDGIAELKNKELEVERIDKYKHLGVCNGTNSKHMNQ